MRGTEQCITKLLRVRGKMKGFRPFSCATFKTFLLSKKKLLHVCGYVLHCVQPEAIRSGFCYSIVSCLFFLFVCLFLRFLKDVCVTSNLLIFKKSKTGGNIKQIWVNTNLHVQNVIQTLDSSSETNTHSLQMTKRKADTDTLGEGGGHGAVSPSSHATEALAEAIAAALIAGSVEQLAAAVLRDAHERGNVAVPSASSDGQSGRIGRRVEGGARVASARVGAGKNSTVVTVEYEARTGGSCGRCGALSVSDNRLERRLMEAARGGDTEGALRCVAHRFANLLHAPRCTIATASAPAAAVAAAAVGTRRLFSRVGILQSDSSFTPPIDASPSIGRSALYHAAFAGHSATVAALSVALRALVALSGDAGVSVRSPFSCAETESAAVTVRCVAICSSAVVNPATNPNNAGANEEGDDDHDNDDDDDDDDNINEEEEEESEHEWDIHQCEEIAASADPSIRFRKANDILLRYATIGDLRNMLALVADFGADVNVMSAPDKHTIPHTSAHNAALHHNARTAVAMLRVLRAGSTVSGPCDCCAALEAGLPAPNTAPAAVDASLTAPTCAKDTPAFARRNVGSDNMHRRGGTSSYNDPSDVAANCFEEASGGEEEEEEEDLIAYFMPTVWPRAWRGADMNIVAPYSNATPLTTAATQGTLTAVVFLLEHCEHTLASVGRFGATTPLARGIERRRVDVVETLLRFGANPNERPRSMGCLSPLHVVSHGGSGPSSNAEAEVSDAPDTAVAQIIRLLIDAGADVSITDGYGDTPLAHAARRCRCAVVAALLRERGEDFSVAQVEAARDLALANGTDSDRGHRRTVRVLNDHLRTITPQ